MVFIKSERFDYLQERHVMHEEELHGYGILNGIRRFKIEFALEDLPGK